MCKIIGLILTQKYIMAYYIIAQTIFFKHGWKVCAELAICEDALNSFAPFFDNMHACWWCVYSVCLHVCLHVCVCVCVVRVYCVCL